MRYLKTKLTLLILSLLVGFNTLLYASDQDQNAVLEKQLAEYKAIRMKEPVKAKDGLLHFIANHAQELTNEQLANAYIVLGSTFEHLSVADSAAMGLEQSRKLMSDDFSNGVKFDYYKSFGNYHVFVKAYDSAIYYYDKADETAKIIDKPQFYATVYTCKGNLADDMNQPKVAFEFYLKALRNFEAISDTKSVAVILNNLGNINQKLGNYERSLGYYYRAIAMNKSIDAVYDISMNYGNLGISYKEVGMLNEAIATLDTALMIAEKNGFIADVARNKLNMGNLYVKLGNLDAAEKNLLESLKLCEEYKLDYGIMLNYNALSLLYIKKESFQTAEFYTKKANELGTLYGELDVLRETNLNLSIIYEKKGQFKAALKHHKIYESFKDSLISLSHKNLITELQTRYDTEKKELENVSLKAENEVKEQAIKDQKIINMIISIALLILILLLFFVFRMSNKLKKANQNLSLLNQKIANQNTVLEETIKTKDKLFSIIGHDLRSPFNSMLGYLQIMIDQKGDIDPEERALILNKIYSKSNDTYTLVENLLQWAMSQRGQIAFRPDHHNLYEIVDDELRFLQSRADKKQIRLINNLPEYIQIWCDQNMVSTVFRNIINNAIKFTPLMGYVKLSAEVKSEFVFVTISDNGVGMDAEIIKRIEKSDEFYSLRGTENESGTGLGLKIVKDFLVTNKALFTISSVPGEGTNFTIRFTK